MTLAPEAVRSMSDRIAPVYDAMNRVMTAGLDLRWRRIAAAAVVRPGDRVLDAACGTGDLAIAAAGAGAGEVVGVDFSGRMLERARRKSRTIEWVQGDILALPFPDEAYLTSPGAARASAINSFTVDAESVLRAARKYCPYTMRTIGAKSFMASYGTFACRLGLMVNSGEITISV